MDIVKIGKYIASKRKELGMTQRQLAEMLGMSDKSVSKWERGVCLPDVSVYSGLCNILGISINEFLAGEDILQENIIQKSEENIIGVANDSKKKQHRLKTIIIGLLVISLLATTVICVSLMRKLIPTPENYIIPLGRDTIEMQTAELFAGMNGAYMYEFRTTDEYNFFRLRISEYHSGNFVNEELVAIGYESVGSPEEGVILIVPDFEDSVVKIVISMEGEMMSTEWPILEGISDMGGYGRVSTSIMEKTDIIYDEQQPLMALVYDNDEMRSPDLTDMADGVADSLTANDYVYYFSFEFGKEGYITAE